MPNKIKTVLAINPGTRYLGLAIFYGERLKDWRIKVLRGSWSRRKMKKALQIVAYWIERYEPDYLAIKKLHPARVSDNLTILANEIQQLGHLHELTVKQYPIKQLEAFLCKEQRKNKQNLAVTMAATYPELYQELNTEKARKNPYHMRMFEAVALGTMCLRDNH